MDFTSFPISRRSWLIASGVILLLFIGAAFGSAWRKPIAQGFDEVAHVSYAASLQRNPGWPRLESLRMLDPVSFAVTPKPNYLDHPPFYYALLAAFGPPITDHPDSLLALRLINIAISAFGMAALLWLGWSLRLGRYAFYGFTIFIAATPVLAPLAGSVNNDNLGFTGGGIALAGLARYLTTRSRAALLVACSGLLIAGAAKLTALLLVGGLFGAALMLAATQRPLARSDLVFALAALLVAALPYFAFVLQYGSPTPNTPAQQMLLTSGAEAAGWANQPRLSVISYTAFFLRSFFDGWLPTLEERSGLQKALFVLPALLAALALFGTLMSARAVARRNAQVADVLVVSGMLAIVATLAIHIAFSYQRHIATGWMMDAYPRYYLPLVAIVPMAILRLAARASGFMRKAIVGFLIAAPVIFLLPDGFGL